LLGNKLKVSAPTGVASFIIDSKTLHSLLHLPTKGEFKELEGKRPCQLQDEFSGIAYIITDEISMVGRKYLAQLTDVSDMRSPIMPKKCSVVVPSCYLETLASYLQ